MAGKAKGTPPWKQPIDRGGHPAPTEGGASIRERMLQRQPEPVELDDAELARRRRNIRRWGWGFVALCFVITVAAALVMLTINRGTADLGLQAIVAV